MRDLIPSEELIRIERLYRQGVKGPFCLCAPLIDICKIYNQYRESTMKIDVMPNIMPIQEKEIDIPMPKIDMLEIDIIGSLTEAVWIELNGVNRYISSPYSNCLISEYTLQAIYKIIYNNQLKFVHSRQINSHFIRRSVYLRIITSRRLKLIKPEILGLVEDIKNDIVCSSNYREYWPENVWVIDDKNINTMLFNYIISVGEFGTRVSVLIVKCPSTKKTHALFVDPRISNAEEARRSTFGMNMNDEIISET